MKTKLGISVGLMGAALYFFGLFSGYVALVILAGYVLIREDNDWLRRSAVRAVAICLIFSILSAVIGFIPDIIRFIDSIVGIFGGSFHISFISSLITVIDVVLDILQKVVLLVMGFLALHQGSMPLGGIDKMIDKNM